MSPKITQIGQDLTAELLDHKEFEVLSIDATMRCCLSNLGQARPRAAKVERDAAVFRGDGALTCVLTVRGRSSAVLLMEALSSDGSEACVRALADHLPARGLARLLMFWWTIRRKSTGRSYAPFAPASRCWHWIQFTWLWHVSMPPLANEQQVRDNFG